MKLSLSLFLFLAISFLSNGQKSGSVNLYFYLSDSQLTENSKLKLDSLVGAGGKIEITSLNAFCDPSGTNEFNNKLARERSQRVQNYLTDKGIAFKGITITGENYSQSQIQKEDYPDMRKVVLNYSSVTETTATNENPFGKLNLEDIKSKKNNTLVLKIQFVPGKDILLDDSSHINVYQFFEFMKYNEKVHAFIRGHVCCASDYQLSLERAYKVYNELVQRGISPSRLRVKGFSNTEPLVPEITEEDQQKNRRVDVIFSIPTE